MRRHGVVSLITVAVAAGFIALGAYRGEALTILKQAIVVCLECVGIG